MVTQWVPLYESNAAAVKSEMATFFNVFPNGTVWGNEVEGRGYDLLLLGRVGRLEINLLEAQLRLGSEDYRPVSRSLREAGFPTAFSLLTTYAGRATDLRQWLRDAELNPTFATGAEKPLIFATSAL
jgi:spermidine synthase